MLSVIVAFSALSLGQPGSAALKLSNPRPTFGSLGAPRADAKLLPGDHLYLAFDIEGISTDAAGKASYRMTTEVLDAAGKTIFKQDPRDQEATTALGGGTLPAYAQVDVGLNAKPGKYTVKVTVTDLASKASGSFAQDAEVLPAGFGVVRVVTSVDPDGRIHSAVFQPGATLWLTFGVVGFEGAPNKPRATAEVRVLDEAGKPTLAKPFTGSLTNESANGPAFLPGQFMLALNRAGRFTVELKATDPATGKTSTATFPIVVVTGK